MIRFRVLGGSELVAANGQQLHGLLAQPKRVALLAYLALARPRGFQRREHLFALFWPDSDESRARSSLRQAVFSLRKWLGEDVIASRGDDEIQLLGVWCDAVAFEEAVAAGRYADALDLYHGELLPAFHFSDVSKELEEWLEQERRRLAGLAARAAWQLSEAKEGKGDLDDAVRFMRRVLSFMPLDESALRRLLALQDARGDRASAVHEYEQFVDLLETELDVAPAPETAQLAATIRARGEPRPGDYLAGNGGAIATPSAIDAFSPPPIQFRHGRSRGLRAAAVTGSALSLLFITALVWPGWAKLLGPQGQTVFAVGNIRDGSGDSRSDLARALPEMLTTRLMRTGAFRIISRARLYELMADSSSAAFLTAARRAGAQILVEGTLLRRSNGQWQLEWSIIDTRTGNVREAHVVQSGDPFDLVERATAQFVSGRGARAGTADGIGGVSTHSLVAYRFYEEGLRAYYRQSNPIAAHRFFTAALAEDSSFAMAAYYSAITIPDSLARSHEYLRRAVRLADRASDYERLLIRGSWADFTNDPSGLAFADTMSARHPHEPDGHFLLTRALSWRGEFLAAIPHARRVLEMDSLGWRGVVLRCRACDAYEQIIDLFMLADSLPAAERTAREWVRAQPTQIRPVAALAFVLERAGKLDEALRTLRHLSMLAGSTEDENFRWRVAIRKGDFATADSISQQMVRDQRPESRGGELWRRMISLRYQGRLVDAVSAAQQYRAIMSRNVNPGDRVLGLQMEGLAQFDFGAPRHSAALFDSANHLIRSESANAPPAQLARANAWLLTHKAMALAAVADTAQLAQLADTIEYFGARSAYGRDRKVHHHVRGLLLQTRGDWHGAVQHFRAAVYSPTAGYTRTNYELARSLLMLDRPQEAIKSVQPAFRGPLDASNLYVTRTELHLMLARAFKAAGQADSAGVHYAAVLAAWRRGDPVVRRRLDAL